MQNVAVTPQFKKKAYRAILSIVLFVATYIALMALAVGLAILCGYAAIYILSFHVSIITIMLALGCVGVGLLTLFFLIKFMFTRNKTDLSGFTEITRNEEPGIFALIDSVVEQAGTDFPKKVYISHEVNASVFYDSGFWSMFLPVRKNLHIGLGLMNTVTVDELKGIIAHEFGHFSQRSMKVGSYVYNVNYIIHNMLYQNEGYTNIVSKLANIHAAMSLPIIAGMRIVYGIQLTLQQVYKVVNISYMALSREMEFHADEVAANIAGPQTLITSLVRMELASKSLNEIYSFYGNRASQNLKPQNIFPKQFFAMSVLAKEFDLPFKDGLPLLTYEHGSRFNKSKIEIGTQWMSHPSNKDRINRLISLNLPDKQQNGTAAMTLFSNPEKMQRDITEKLFSAVNYDGAVSWHTYEDFEQEYTKERGNNSFSKMYNNYFDDTNLSKINVSDYEGQSTVTSAIELFSNEKIELVYNAIGIENDIEILKQVKTGNTGVKSFDYDGKRYSKTDIDSLLPELEKQLQQFKAAIDDNNTKIVQYFYSKARLKGTAEEYKLLLDTYISFNDFQATAFTCINNVYKHVQFLNTSTVINEIENNLRRLFPHELKLKEVMQQYISEAAYKDYIPEETVQKIQQYLDKNYIYFAGGTYNQNALGILFDALRLFNESVSKQFFTHKKDFLDFQAGLES
ncbi:M48 family metallopeptidase [Flavobacterium sp. RHBU_24]|uniref:M48 family metallopeptidase n=1 Tax=Flavobacterium sp. RHBU_24 TaxID=3391185 RepID=UPI0039847472